MSSTYTTFLEIYKPMINSVFDISSLNIFMNISCTFSLNWLSDRTDIYFF